MTIKFDTIKGEVNVKAILSTWKRSGGFRTEYSYGVYALTTDNNVDLFTTGKQPDYAPGLFYETPEVNATENHYKLANECFENRDKEWKEKKIDSLNSDNVELSKYPSIGKLVRITKGKDKGKEGVIFWAGVDRYGNSRYNNNGFRASAILAIIKSEGLNHIDTNKNRFGLKDDKGKVFWVNVGLLEVVNPDEYLLPENKIIEKVENLAVNNKRRFIDGKLIEGEAVKNLRRIF
jgi:hypothetical protein